MNRKKGQVKGKLYVQMFTHFEISGMGAFLDEETIHSEMLIKLFTYVLCHRNKEISVQELVDALWHDEKSNNPAGALKNLVYRYRNLMEKYWPERDFLLTGHGSYNWNSDIEVESDLEEFEKSYRAGNREKDMSRRIDLYDRAVNLYKGPFLPKLSGEYWVASMSTYYHSMYLSVVKKLSRLLEQSRRYGEMEHICSRAILLDNLDERLHCCFIKALIGQKKLKLAEEHYHTTADILYENLGVAPSKELRSVYEEILKETHQEERNIHAIKKELNDEEGLGAFLCEYGVFKKACQLEQRREPLRGMDTYLLLITVIPTLDLKPESQGYLNIINEGMEHLERVLLHSLRFDDVMARYSGTQFIIMLSPCQQEAVRIIMRKISSRFEKNSRKKLHVELEYSIDKLGNSSHVNHYENLVTAL